MVRIAMPFLLYFHILFNAYTFDLDPRLVMAVIWAESTFRADAVGNAGMSFGLMQLHLGGAGHGHSREELLDPAANIRIGCEYLRACMDAAGNNIPDAVSAYNQGIAGWKARGRIINQDHVNRYMHLYQKLNGAMIIVMPDILGKIQVYIAEI